MPKPRFTQDQIKAIVSELVAGQMAGEISRRYGISISTLYRWRAKFAGDDNRMIKSGYVHWRMNIDG